MSRMIFVNLPITNLAVSRAFYEGIGFSINELFSDDSAACVVVSETIYVMILTHKRWEDFSRLPAGDAKAICQHLLALTCDDRAGVDRIFDAALENGGREYRDSQDLGFMYSRAFADPDGHVWEPFWMDPAAAAGGPPKSES